MDTEQFRRAINSGLGRAILHLRDHSWKPHAEAIEQACPHHPAHDPQCESSRAGYVYEIIRLTDDPRHFADITTEALLQASNYWDTFHLFELAGLFAKDGDARAFEAMLEKFRRNDAGEFFQGDNQLVRAGGERALIFVADQIGQWLPTHADYEVGDYFLKAAGEVLGTDAEQLLAKAAVTNPNIHRYLEAVKKCKQTPRSRQSPDYRHFSYEELRERIIQKNSEVSRGWLFGWGKHAPETALRAAAADLIKEQNDKVLVAYLGIFNSRPFPLDRQRVIELAKAENRDVARASWRVLRHIRHTSVRAFALALMEKGAGEEAVPLLVKNFEQGDEQRVKSLLDQPWDEDDYHWLAHDTVDIFEANPDAEALDCMLRVYERVRCSICRSGAVKVLMKRRKMPTSMVEECRFDSNEDIRQAVAG